MAKVGRKVSFPANTPKEKTYLWRWLKVFKNRIDEWELDQKTTAKFISYIVDYARQNKQLNRGAAILNRDDILKICYDRLRDELHHCENMYDRLSKEVQVIDGNLLDNPNGGYPNIVQWYHSGLISLELLSLSAKCIKAISNLNEEDAAELPDKRQLIKTRTRILLNEDLTKLREILGGDLITSGVPV